jgi:glucose/arabinose dehydrogenase
VRGNSDRMRGGAALATLVGSGLLVPLGSAPWYDHLLSELRVPSGFNVEVYAEVPAARSLAVAPSGTVFVGAYDFSGIQGADGSKLAVYALRDLNGDGSATGPSESVPVTEQMTCPNGVSFLNGDLYVAQMDRVLRYANVEDNIETIKNHTVVIDSEFPVDSGTGLPETHWHGWRYMRANTKTNKMYVTIGSPCNVPGNGEILDCNDTAVHPLLGSICEFDPNSPRPKLEVVAHGIRNSLGLAFHPATDDLWFTENGRDEWGGTWSYVHGRWQLEGGTATEDMPPGEINRLPAAAIADEEWRARDPPYSLDYGFPRCYGRDHPDPSPDWSGAPYNSGSCRFAPLQDLADMATAREVGAVVDLPAHSATLGMEFYPSDAPTGSPAFPPEYRGSIFYSSHGSWDRTMPSGYVVGRAALACDPAECNSHSTPAELTHFLSGFRLDPPVPCTATADCPGNSSCQTRAPSHGQATRYCGGIGRPADVRVISDGSMLITDETNSLVYRISYGDHAAPSPSPTVAPPDGMGAGTVILLILVLLVVLFAVAATLWPRADRPKWMTLIVDTICGGSVCKKYMGYDDASIYTTGGEFPAGHVFEDGRGASHVVS